MPKEKFREYYDFLKMVLVIKFMIHKLKFLFFSLFRSFSLQHSAFSLLIACSLLTSCATEPPVIKLEKANVLPLAIDRNFAFRKETQFLNDPATFRPSRSDAVSFMRRSYMWPATTRLEQDALRGSYLNFYWWNHGPRQDVTIRLEYHQAGLGNEVLAREINYPQMQGSRTSVFKIIGDDYLENGRVTSWRALLIVDGKIVGLTQSFLWK